jgi:ferrous-iron efflux pump FieF
MTAEGTLMQRTAWAAIIVALVLVFIKLAAYLISDSIAMLASLADSAVDVFASAINLIAIRHALMPADAEHRFGHGKAEPLAGLMQSAFIAGSVAFLAIESVSRLLEPHAIVAPAIALGAVGVSIVLLLILLVVQEMTVRRTGSIAIRADRMHYVGDLLSNLGVVLGVVLSSRFGWQKADPAVGLIISFLLALSAVHVFRQSYDQLMDRELPDEERDRIRQIVMRHKDVTDLHDLRTRMAGVHTFIQLHLELDPAMSLTRAHAVSDAVEADLMEAFPRAEVIIHQDPAGLEPTLSEA